MGLPMFYSSSPGGQLTCKWKIFGREKTRVAALEDRLPTNNTLPELPDLALDRAEEDPAQPQVAANLRDAKVLFQHQGVVGQFLYGQRQLRSCCGAANHVLGRCRGRVHVQVCGTWCPQRSCQPARV